MSDALPAPDPHAIPPSNESRRPRLRVTVKPGSDPATLKPLVQALARIATKMAQEAARPMDVAEGA